MDGPLLFLIVAAVVALLVTGAYFGWKAERERRAALAAVAGEWGLSFDPEPDRSHDDEYAQFEIFRRGHSRVAKNTLHGTIELFGRACRVRAGDFRYEVDDSDNKGTTTHRFSYVIVHPPWPTPSLLVRPEGIFDRIKGALGFEDIDFESAEFSRRFYVQSSNKRFAYDVLHPRMMDLLLAQRPPMLDIEGGALCLSDGGRRWRPEEFQRQFDFVRRFCELWPRHLVKEFDA